MILLESFHVKGKKFGNTIYRNQVDGLKVEISWHKRRFKHLNFHYIYRISYRNAKKAIPLKQICLLGKRYHNNFKTLDVYKVIAVSTAHLSFPLTVFCHTPPNFKFDRRAL